MIVDEGFDAFLEQGPHGDAQAFHGSVPLQVPGSAT
jgi:hypothetical protein